MNYSVSELDQNLYFAGNLNNLICLISAQLLSGKILKWLKSAVQVFFERHYAAPSF